MWMTHTCAMDVRRFDVFLSYNSLDRPTVKTMAERLRADGLQPWWDGWALTPGRSWQDEIVEGLGLSRSYAVIVGPAGLGDWAREELAVAQDLAAKNRDFRIFMVLLPGAPELSDPRLAFLRTRTWVDLRKGIADPDGRQDLISAITGAPRSVKVASAASGTCPYRGLAPFDEEHAEFFVGRDDDTARVVEKLKTSRFLAVLGPSGSGKSSLLRAGVVPSLRRGVLGGSEGWVLRLMTPGARPLTTLASSLTRQFQEVSMQRTLDQLGEDERTLDLAAHLGLGGLPSADRLVLVVDQFEEIFTLTLDEAERRAFLRNLVYAATIPGGQVMIVIGMRADFYERCASYRDLRVLVADEQFLVGPLDSHGLRSIIEEPARRVGLDFEAGLVETILSDVGDPAGVLPLLEHMLLELWERRRGTLLTLEAYVASGRAEGALAQRANAVYSTLPELQKVVARNVLLRLIQPGEGADTVRRAEIRELVTRSADERDVVSVVRALADQRLLTVSQDEVSGSGTVRITHEALIRGWPELRSWIEEDRDLLRAQRHLGEAAAEWKQNGRHDEDLYGGARLAYWSEHGTERLTEFEAAFVAAGLDRAERDRRAHRSRTQRAVTLLVIALVAISSVALVALRAQSQASEQRDIARSRELAASATAQLGINPERSLLLAIRAFELKSTPQAAAILRQATFESRVRRTITAHEGVVWAASFSPDGQLIVSAGDDGSVRIWDVARPSEPVVLAGHDGPVYKAAFSPDGQSVVTAGGDATVRIWDTSGTERLVLTGHSGPVYNASFSPDGRFVASVGEDATLRLWDATTSADPIILIGHNGPVWAVAVSPDGQLVASGDDDGVVKVWERMGGAERMTLTPASGSVQAVVFSPDGQLLATAAEGGDVRLWPLAGGDPRQLVGHKGNVNDVAFSPDGKRIVSAGGDGTVQVWDRASTTAEPIVLHGHEGFVSVSAFSPDGRTVISAGRDGTVRLWDPAPLGAAVRLEGQGDAVQTVAFSSDGRAIFTGSTDGSVREWDLANGARRQLYTHDGPVNGLALMPRSGRLISAGTDGVRIFDLSTSEASPVRQHHDGPVWAVAASPDESFFVTGGEDGTVRLWDPSGVEEPSVRRGHEGPVWSVAVSVDGSRFVSGGEDGTVRVWARNGQQGSVVHEGHEGAVYSVAISHDGRLVASSSDDSTVRIWDVDRLLEPQILRGHQGAVWDVAFGNGDRYVVTGGNDETVRVWNVAEPRDVLVFASHGAVRDVAVGYDGHRFASGGHDQTAFWSCDTCGPVDEVLQLARARVTRDFTSEEASTFVVEGRDR